MKKYRKHPARRRVVIVVALGLSMALFAACEPANTEGIDLPPPGVTLPDPIYSETMYEQMRDWMDNSDGPDCEVCTPEQQAELDAMTPEERAKVGELFFEFRNRVGVGSCGWLTCTLIFSGEMTRLIAYSAGIVGPVVEGLLSVTKMTWLVVLAGSIMGYVFLMAMLAIDRTPDGCLAIRMTHFPNFPIGVPTWIGHVHAGNRRCIDRI